jgi:hypothetical protein
LEKKNKEKEQTRLEAVWQSRVVGNTHHRQESWIPGKQEKLRERLQIE